MPALGERDDFMDPELIAHIAERLMRCPAAPYHEHGPRAAAEAVCAEHGLDCRRDEFGNLAVTWKHGRKQRPLVLAAHLDHPGFHIVRPAGRNRWAAEFRGGVPEAYFKSGLAVRLMPGAVPAKLTKKLTGKKRFELTAASSVAEPPKFAVWELEDFKRRGERIHGRACDDLIGCATILAVLIELKRKRAAVQVLGLLSRAEEVGFHGVLAAASGKLLPAKALVISLETSREMPPAKMGRGVILRVGDRSSIFDSAAMRFLGEVANGRQRRDSKFAFQRALMSGGTCEATAFQEFGYQTGAVCVALGNYHNCEKRGRIAAEYVDLGDVTGMACLLLECARKMKAYGRMSERLPQRLRRLAAAARRGLKQH
jgi:putative aminopeptidase FrvX